MARLLSLNVAIPKERALAGRDHRAAMSKYPVTGPRMLRTLNVDGDGQGDIWRGYDGEIRAVLASPTTTGDSDSDATTSNAACGGASILVSGLSWGFTRRVRIR
ncbi:hypothetical protein GA0070624_3476 [Micromonospora rhizosphaerae]|uniref:Uncharacterized protein n=1 Tax=Micromonospora rhizosphaerae TaxID=568872 RepID=A0A1C6SCV6_9ACTN|nr:hypothetical protein GA0070624_3476 [Micromonospora rhizosphaerae]